MIKRSEVLKGIVENCKPEFCLISQLGRTSRDLFAISHGLRSQCFHMLGSMGSVIPFALGVSMSKSSIFAIAIEGDGSLLMNLGTLATVKKYALNNLVIVILNNNQYESTGGQRSQQQDNFDLVDVCRSFRIDTRKVQSLEILHDFFEREIRSLQGPVVLVVETLPEQPAPRISDKPTTISSRFSQWLLNN
ncbi:MAG: thiamine pyrophosphate-dependent enzyme [Flavisolibacter sp.]